MDAVKFLKVKTRMCNSVNCCECPLDTENNGKRVNCQVIERDYTEEAVSIVEKWSKEHPVKTRQKQFLKMFPNVAICHDVIDINPCELDTKIKHDCSCFDSCYDCKRNYWFAEVE